MLLLRRLTILLALFAAACAGTTHKKDMTADELYAAAKAAVANRDYEDAQKLFDRIRDEYPFSKLAVESELLAADMAFQQEKWPEAAAAYRAFEELHPTHPQVPYALYRRGLADAKLAATPDRDQTANRKALEAFQKLLYGYPGSEHAPDARKRLAGIRSTLAAHELYVAQYYIRKKQYAAASNRLEGLLRDYPDAPAREQAAQLAAELKGREGEKSRGN